MAKFKIGDRVIYRHTGRRTDWRGKIAVITHVNYDDHYDVKWDVPGSTDVGYNIPEASLSLGVGLDITKPLLIRNSLGTCQATLIGVLADGNIAVESADLTRIASGFLVYDSEGKFVRSGFGGSATTLENEPEPVVTKAYINVGSAMMNGGGSLYANRQHTESIAQIEVTLTDGVVTGAELVQPGKLPVEVRG